LKKIILILLAISCTVGYSQSSKRIKVLSSDNTTVDERFPGAIITLGNVFVEHEGATLRCDKAYIYQERNLIKAMGNVIINQGDTIHQYSKYVDYDGNTKISTSWGNVKLKDELMELETDTLRFNRSEQKLYFNHKGTIKDTANVLVSDRGRYHLKFNKFEAFDNVVVTNRDGSVLNSNHLDYYTSSGIAYLFEPSTITEKDSKIYTEEGVYNSKTHKAHFTKNSKIYYKDVEINGDSLYYDKNNGFASATGNFKMIDTVNNSIVKGGYAEMYRLKDSVFVTDKAVAISEIEPKDSMYIHGQKLMVLGKEGNRILKAFNKVKFYKFDLQGKCDSLISFETKGLTKLIDAPVMWANGSQITGDTIHLISNTKTEQLDSLKILGNAFMIQKDTLSEDGYSQLKGKNMYGKFIDNAINTLDVVGNSEVIFYLRDEFKVLLGIEKMICSKNIFIIFKGNGIDKIKYFEMPSGKLYPPSDWENLNIEDRKFKGFIWREGERPITKDHIFIHDEEDDENESESEKQPSKEAEKEVIETIGKN